MDSPLLEAWASTMVADVSRSGVSVEVWNKGTASFTETYERRVSCFFWWTGWKAAKIRKNRWEGGNQSLEG